MFPGHRRSLPMNHALRMYGQSKVCCPSTYYVEEVGNTENLNEENTLTTMESKTLSIDTIRSIRSASIGERKSIVLRGAKLIPK